MVGVPSSFAGPSEVVVVADGSAPSEFAAIDLIVQAEHGPDGLAWLVTWDEDCADEVTADVERLVRRAPRRDDIESTLADSGYCVLCSGPAPGDGGVEPTSHRNIWNSRPTTTSPLLGLVRDAGAVFCECLDSRIARRLCGRSLPCASDKRHGTVRQFVGRCAIS